MQAQQAWRVATNEMLYGLSLERELPDSVVDQAANGLIKGQIRGRDPQDYYDAISEALASGETISGPIPTRHSEAEVRDFLHRLLARLDALRPWPQPPYRKKRSDLWSSFGNGRAIARLDASINGMRDRLRTVFDQLPSADESVRILVLELPGGQLVGLLGSTNPRNPVTLLQPEGAGDPAATIDAFAEATGFPRDKITPVD